METLFHIEIIPTSPHDKTATVDGVEQPNGIIKLIDDKGVHSVIVKCPTFTGSFVPQSISMEEMQNNENESKS